METINVCFFKLELIIEYQLQEFYYYYYFFFFFLMHVGCNNILFDFNIFIGNFKIHCLL